MKPKTTAQMKRERQDNTMKAIGFVIIVIAGFRLISAMNNDRWPEALFWLVLGVIVRLSMRGGWRR